MNGIDLFSGYGGISLGLQGYVRPLVYCEIDPYPQGILLSRMDEGSLPFAPIWGDVTKLDGKKFRGLAEIIYGGFPCQNISTAGDGKGLDGERSGLFWEIIRLTKEASPRFVFLENVPAIRTRGLLEVVTAFTALGYDCRWTCLTASSVGANHRRGRWFLLAHSDGKGLRNEREWSPERKTKTDDVTGDHGAKKPLAHSDGLREQSEHDKREWVLNGSYHRSKDEEWRESKFLQREWWDAELPVGRMVNGATLRMDQIKFSGNEMVHKTQNRALNEEEISKIFRKDELKALGNGVVPLQVRVAFEKLMGIKY